MTTSKKSSESSLLESENETKIFTVAAALFALFSTPVRLKILSAVCDQERTVSEILDIVQTTQPNLSQHLKTLYRAGILSKRNEKNKVFYSVKSLKAAQLCRSVCTQIAIEMDTPDTIATDEKLLPLMVHDETASLR